MFAECCCSQPRIQRLISMESGVMRTAAFVALRFGLLAAASLVGRVAAVVTAVRFRPEGESFVPVELPEVRAFADLMFRIPAEGARTWARMRMRMRMRVRMRMRMRLRLRRDFDRVGMEHPSRHKLGLRCH